MRGGARATRGRGTGGRPSLVEAMGLRPVRQRVREALVALRGAEDVPASGYDVSSLSLLSPRLGVPLWAGRFVVPRRAIVTNLYNHRQTPVAEGWSVRRRQTLDFRGRQLTYDSHNGTDFAIPVGTTVCAAASGRVVRVYAEFNRGGLKLCIDHGEGLMTCMAHLARALVDEGDRVEAGQPVAVSGYSGLDGFVTFPWGVPHVHFNVWLDGVPVDPFAPPGEVGLWVGDDGLPRPVRSGVASAPAAPSRYDAGRLSAVVASCVTPSARARLEGIEPLERRGAFVVCERNYYPTRFGDAGSVYTEVHPRAPRLYLPFEAGVIEGVVFVDDA